MVLVDFAALRMSWEDVLERLRASGVNVNPPTGNNWRIVTHRDVDEADIVRLVDALA
jgi:hypothetical protein